MCQDVFANLVTKNGTTEHRAAVCHLFCVKIGDSATTTHGKLQQAFGDDAMSRAQALKASAHRTRPSAAARPLSKAASPRGLGRANTKRPTAVGHRFRYSLQRSVERAKG
jgi:hypothetical protein